MRAILALCLALSLTSCGAIQTAQEASRTPVGEETVATARAVVYGLKSAYGAAVATAVAYARRPSCQRPPAPILCSDDAAVQQLAKAQLAAGAALREAEQAVLDVSPSSSRLRAAMVGARSAYEGFQNVMIAYRVEK